MANFETPKGFVFIPRYYSNDRNQAAELLEAADEVGADRQADVVSVSNGYHVKKKVAAKWAELYESEESAGDDDGDNDALPVTAESSNAEIDEYAGSLEPAVDLSEARNRTEKIALLEAARQPATTDTDAE